METKRDIYELIKQEEEAYRLPIAVTEGYNWNMFDHIQLTTLYKNSQLKSGKNENKPVKNIILPLLRLQYRSEGFDVKDINLFVNSSKDYYKSILVRKFHEKWARDNDIDTFIDEIVESYVDFGGALVKDVNGPRPEVVPMQSIAFCDQTDILSGTIAIKHNFAPDQLLEMAGKGWGKEGTTLEEVITLAENNKSGTQTPGVTVATPGKYIEVYEVHGMFPTSWLDKGENAGEEYSTETSTGEVIKYSRQVHIVCFTGNDKAGVCLFKGKLAKNPFKLILRDKIYGRALGMGGAEELFEAQVWTTYDQIRIKGMLDAASKVILKSTDPAIVQKHPTGLKNMDNLSIIDMGVGTDIQQLNTTPVNMTVFENNITHWQEHGQQMASATDALMGESPSAGSPFKLQELITQNGQGLHDYRKGKLATFMNEIYRDFILPRLVKDIVKGHEFIAECDIEELQYIADALVTNVSNQRVVEMVIAGEEVTQEQVDLFKGLVRDQFMKGGMKKFMQIFKDEMKDAPMDIFVNIAGKQKNLTKVVDNLTNIFRQIIAAPQVLDDPRMGNIFNQILQASGLDPIDTYGKSPVPMNPEQVAQTLQTPVPTG